MDETKRHRIEEGSNNVKAKDRIMYEIENLVGLYENGPGFDILNSRSNNRQVVSRRDLYKLYLGILRDKGAERNIVYSGRNIIEMEEVEDMEEDIEELELSIGEIEM